MKRIFAASFAAKVAFKHPELMVGTHWEVMSTLYERILMVQEKNQPCMVQIGIILPSEDKHVIATVWVGSGADSSPVKRIEELYNENKALKQQLSELVS